MEAGRAGFSAQQDVFVIAGPACGEAKAELFTSIHYFLAISLFQNYYVIKAHQESLVSASDVVWLVEMGNWSKVPELLLLLMWTCRTNFRQ